MKASPIYFPNPKYLLMCIWWVGFEGYKNPIIFRFFLKSHDRRSEYSFVESCLLLDDVDDRNGKLQFLSKRIFKKITRIQDKRTNISFVSYCTSSLRFVPKGCIKYFLLFFFLRVIIILKILEWWWLCSHFWWAV